jgi:hypothetical protein
MGLNNHMATTKSTKNVTAMRITVLGMTPTFYSAHDRKASISARLAAAA